MKNFNEAKKERKRNPVWIACPLQLTCKKGAFALKELCFFMILHSMPSDK